MGTLIYFPKMEGMVFVLKWNTEIMDYTAIVSMRNHKGKYGQKDGIHENEPKSG
jgi:hypothetical protein